MRWGLPGLGCGWARRSDPSLAPVPPRPAPARPPPALLLHLPPGPEGGRLRLLPWLPVLLLHSPVRSARSNFHSFVNLSLVPPPYLLRPAWLLMRLPLVGQAGGAGLVGRGCSTHALPAGQHSMCERQESREARQTVCFCDLSYCNPAPRPAPALLALLSCLVATCKVNTYLPGCEYSVITLVLVVSFSVMFGGKPCLGRDHWHLEEE